MAITSHMMKSVTAHIYKRSLKKIARDTKDALKNVLANKSSEGGRKVLRMKPASTLCGGQGQSLLCLYSGILVDFSKISIPEPRGD